VTAAEDDGIGDMESRIADAKAFLEIGRALIGVEE